MQTSDLTQKPNQWYSIGLFIGAIFILMNIIPIFRSEKDYVVKIGNTTFSRLDYKLTTNIAGLFYKDTPLTQHAFAMRHLLIAEAKPLGITCNKQEILDYINSYPAIKLRFFSRTNDDGSTKINKIEDRNAVIKFIQDDIIQKKVRAKLDILNYADEQYCLKANLKQIANNDIKTIVNFSNPVTQKKLQSYYKDNAQNYNLIKGKKIKIIVIDCSCKKSIEELEVEAKKLYQETNNYIAGYRSGVIIELKDRKSEQLFLNECSKTKSIPLEFYNRIQEEVHSYYALPKYSKLLFSLSKSQPYIKIGAMRYLVLREDVSSRKLSFEERKGDLMEQAAKNDVEEKRKFLEKNSKTLEGIKAIFAKYKDQKVYTYDYYPHQKPFLNKDHLEEQINKRKLNFGIKELSYNTVEVFEVIGLLPDRTLSMSEAIYEVQNDYLNYVKEEQISSLASFKKNVLNNKWDYENMTVTRYDNNIPAQVLDHMFSCQKGDYGFIKLQNDYYIFTILEEGTFMYPPQMMIPKVERDLKLIFSLSRKHRLKINQKQRND